MNRPVLTAADLQLGEVRSVRVGNVPIAVVRLPTGEYRALGDTCSHYGAPLSKGQVEPLVNGTGVGDYSDCRGKYILRCPWHGYEFDLDSGVCPADPRRARVRSYAVVVENGEVLIID
jgi:nitrite reductase (NADH) small subunit